MIGAELLDGLLSTGRCPSLPLRLGLLAASNSQSADRQRQKTVQCQLDTSYVPAVSVSHGSCMPNRRSRAQKSAMGPGRHGAVRRASVSTC